MEASLTVGTAPAKPPRVQSKPTLGVEVSISENAKSLSTEETEQVVEKQPVSSGPPISGHTETTKRQLHFRYPVVATTTTATHSQSRIYKSVRRQRTRNSERQKKIATLEIIDIPTTHTILERAGGQRLAFGCNSLMHACQRGDFPTVLEQLRTKPERVRQVDGKKKNALHYCAAQRAEERDLVAAASIAIAAPELLGSADEDGFTPLHLAVIQGNLAMVNLLLANKADVNAVDNEGHSVVHWATVCGEVDALRSVLAAGANVATPDINGGSPLHYAAQMCGANFEGSSKTQSQTTSPSKLALEILGILLTHPQASVDVQDKDGRQPLLWAASAGSAKAVMALVKAGARVESADKDGLTALHCAASRGHTECIDTLISLCGAPTDLIDSNGCTALHYAVTLGHADATSRLLDLEADPNRQDRKGRTPAHCGCSKGQFETVKLLKEGGANLWLRNAKGDLPVHEAAASGRRELVEWLLQQRPKQVNMTSNDGRSILHTAAANDFMDMCKMLLDFGADVNAVYRSSKGVVITPLDCALHKGNRSIAKFLQANGGLPAGKVRLSARRRPNPFQEATATTEAVRPLKYAEKEELHDLQHSKKYVVYLKNSDERENSCSCTEQTYRKEQRYAHTCRRHRRLSRRRNQRRRTSSCGEAKELRDIRGGGGSGGDSDRGDISRSKSYMEIRPKRGRSDHYATATSSGEEAEEAADSCENCCYHRRQKQRVLRRRSLSLRCSRDGKDSGSEENGEPKKRSSNDEHIVKVDAIDPVEQQAAPTPARPQSATKRQPPPTTGLGAKEGTFVKSSPPLGSQLEVEQIREPYSEPVNDVVPPTDDEEHAQEAEVITTQVDVHREADVASLTHVPSQEVIPLTEKTIADEQTISKTEGDPAVSIPESNDPKVSDSKLADAEVPSQLAVDAPSVINTPATPLPSPLPSPAAPSVSSGVADAVPSSSLSGIEAQAETIVLPVSISQETATVVAEASSKTSATPQRDQESRRSFTLLPSDSAEEEDGVEEEALNESRKSSFQILKSDDSVGEIEDALRRGDLAFQESHVFKVVSPPLNQHLPPSDTEHDGVPEPIQQASGVYDYTGVGTSRKRRLKKRLKSGGGGSRGGRDSGWKSTLAADENRLPDAEAQQHAKDQDSGFEPSPRNSKTKIPTPRNAHTAPRRPIYATTTLDGRSCSSRFENRKLGDRGACDMNAVTRSIQRNIRRYYMERKIFQHLLELKSLQIRSNKLNEAVLIKRAVDEYHKSCASLGGETGTRLRRYTFSEYTFKNFELFLYETLKSLQKPGSNSFQNINEVYEEAERRLSPDYNAYEKALQCTTKTHRCLHAAHAYTGIPCAAYIPMMNHHTMPKFGFGQYKKMGLGSFYLPKILSGGSVGSGGKVALELSHGKSRQLIALPSDKLDSNKRYYVTFTVKQPAQTRDTAADGSVEVTPTLDKPLSDTNCGVAVDDGNADGNVNATTGK